MGIRYMNKYFMQKCKKESIQKIHLSALSNKMIVIDTSIYLYKYAGQCALQENFFSMITLFHKYNVTPIFVFDGKPPPEKKDEMMRRKINKQSAEDKYNNILPSHYHSNKVLTKNLLCKKLLKIMQIIIYKLYN